MREKEKNYITISGKQKLQAEFDHLLKVERPQITQTIQWAASNGDRSENADYIYGKRRLREIDKRMAFLNQRLNCAVVVDLVSLIDSSANKNHPQQVQFGATVTVLDEEQQQRRFSIVGVDEIDLKKGMISWRSPIGSALLGKRVGDSVVIQGPKGSSEWEILTINYLPL